MNPALNNEYQPFSPGYSSEDAKAILSGNVDDDTLTGGSVGASLPNYDTPPYKMVPFRPLAPINGTSNPAVTSSSTVDTTSTDGVMPLRLTHVDPRQYSPVGDEVWTTPMEPSSPSTIDTDDGSPMTPVLDHHSAFFEQYEATFGPLESRLFVADPQSVHSQFPIPTFFGSSTSSMSSTSGPSFAASSSARDSMCSQPPRGLVSGHVPSQVAPVNTMPASSDFDSRVPSRGGRLGEAESSDGTKSAASSPSTVEPVAEGGDRDRLLLEMRRQGYSYKEIKRQCHFKEAESTLRGRMRMLTKEKHERVRKPVWERADVVLLRRAVKFHQRKLSRGRLATKMPWLKISEWIERNGASYAFAPATCAKKWSEIVRK